jgi:L-amino acid N-acyltransferase
MITIRPMKEADLPQTLVIYNDIILHTTAVYSYHPHTIQMREDWYAAKIKEGYPVFVAESEGKVVGFSSFGPFRAWDAYRYTVENSIYVLADQRGKGIGKRLLEPLITTAKEKDLHAIIASIDASNSVSLQLHRSFGFEEVAHFRQVGFKFGRWLDLKFLELLLPTPAHPTDTP